MRRGRRWSRRSTWAEKKKRATGRSFTKPGSGIPCQTLLNAKESDEGTFATVSLGNISTLVCDSLSYPVLELSLLQVRASVNRLSDALNLSSTFSPQILAGTVGSRPQARTMAGASGGGGSGGRSGPRGPGGRGGGGGGGPQGGGGGRPKPSKEAKKARRWQQQQQAVQKKADAEWEHFVRCQQEAATRGSGGQHRPGPRPPTERELFAKQGTAGIKFSSYEKIDVEVKGPGADAVPVLTGFSGLAALPAFLRRNIERMSYERPTPIQKHAVPLALHGAGGSGVLAGQ